jgi:hypothetical protein
MLQETDRASHQSRAMFNETTFKSLLDFSLCLCLYLSVFQFITVDANCTFKRFADLQNVRIKVTAAEPKATSNPALMADDDDDQAGKQQNIGCQSPSSSSSQTVAMETEHMRSYSSV